MYVNLQNNSVLPVIKVDAPSGYGLDNRFMYALNNFENFKRPCGGGNVEACENVKRVILDWAKADAAQRIGAANHEAKHWNDTLTVNLWIASPMMAGYSFAKQRITVPQEEDKIIKEWFKKIVKKNQHLMYELNKYKQGTQAAGVPRSAHNHALSSAISHMQLGILLNDNKLFRKAFKNYEYAIKFQRKDGSMPIETRRGGRAMFYQGRAMTALTAIAIIAENQGYNIWDYDYKDLNNYQRKIISNFDNYLKRNSGSSSWTVVEPRCHFTK